MKMIKIKAKILYWSTWIYNYFVCLRYPFLKVAPSDVYDWVRGYDDIWLDYIPKGWRKAFGWKLCKDLKKYLKDHNITDYKVIQVKEKFGGLRWYHESKFAREIKENVIDKYESLSYYCCVNCGKREDWWSSGYFLPYCDDCKNKITDKQFTKISKNRF